MLDLSPGDPIIKAYLSDIQCLKDPRISHELGMRGPFQTLLDKAARRRGWTLVTELSTYSGGSIQMNESLTLAGIPPQMF